VKRWPEFLPLFVACAFIAIQSYAASRTGVSAIQIPSLCWRFPCSALYFFLG